MRKLHELLPIARQYLIDESTRAPWFAGKRACSPYVCNAANLAAGAGEMTGIEAYALAEAVVEEIDRQSGGLYDMLYALIGARQGALWSSEAVAYLPHRDLWLDEFQLKLERTKQ